MSMRQSPILNKAQTHAFNLPKIAKNTKRYQTNRTSIKVQNKSTYLQKVKNETNQQQQYQYLETSQLSKEQINLKNMLRKFNGQTCNILGKYIENPTDRQKKHKTSSHSVIEIREKQLQNSKTLLEQCRHQLQKLQAKSQNLKFMNVQGFQKKINDLKNQKQQMIEVIKQMKKRNVLRGQQIKKDDNKQFNEIIDFQNEFNKLSIKKQRLQQDTKYVNEQLITLKKKNQKGDMKTKQILPEFQKLKKEEDAEKQIKKNRDLVQQKKKTLKNMKQNGNSNKCQYTYLKLLKQLQETTKKCKEYDQKTTQTNSKILQSKKQLIVCDQKFDQMKKTMPIPSKPKTPEKNKEKTIKNKSQVSRSKSNEKIKQKQIEKGKEKPEKQQQTQEKGIFAKQLNF